MQGEDKKIKMYNDCKVYYKTEISSNLGKDMIGPAPKQIAPQTNEESFWDNEWKNTHIQLNQVQHQGVVLVENHKFNDILRRQEGINGVEQEDIKDKSFCYLFIDHFLYPRFL